MFRLLLAIAATLLLVGSLPTGPAFVGSTLDALTAVDDCCPDDGEGADCCDVDLGACCAASVAARLPEAQAPLGTAGPTLAPVRDAVAFHGRLPPRDTGPPPTPPPIG